jgi:hypothetical protein
MKTKSISYQKAISLLKAHLETSLQHITSLNPECTLLNATKSYLSNKNEILLSSGAKLYYNPEFPEPWFIGGYSGDGSDVDCYFDRSIMNRLIKFHSICPSCNPVVKQKIKLRKLLKDFLESDIRCTWIRTGKVSVYIRKSWRSFNGEQSSVNKGLISNCFDIANIQIHPSLRNLGIFKSFMQIVDEEVRSTETGVYILIENIENKFLKNWCINNNWKKVSSEYDEVSYYKPMERRSVL